MLLKKTVYFTAPGQVDVREAPLPTPGPDEVLVETIYSAISPGTEMLVYRDQCPSIDDSHDTVSSKIEYPAAYGYACVGRVIAIGKLVNGDWKDRLVFAFQPHTSHFTINPQLLITIPQLLSPETASFLPNAETAVNLVQDLAPILGERILVLGQGIVGLLTTALLHEFPLTSLVTADAFPRRRDASLSSGVTASLDPLAAGFREQIRALFPDGADATLELSGAPAALNDAIALTGFGGRIVIGSWYGEKKANLDLGGSFHRSRIKIIASQVSTISPELSARWDKSRRFSVAWDALARIRPEKWITHRFPVENAADAYQLLDQNPQETIQVLFQYS